MISDWQNRLELNIVVPGTHGTYSPNASSPTSFQPSLAIHNSSTISMHLCIQTDIEMPRADVPSPDNQQCITQQRQLRSSSRGFKM